MLYDLVPADQVELLLLPGLGPDGQHAVAVERGDALVVLVPLAVVRRDGAGEQVARERAQPQHRGYLGYTERALAVRTRSGRRQREQTMHSP